MATSNLFYRAEQSLCKFQPPPVRSNFDQTYWPPDKEMGSPGVRTEYLRNNCLLISYHDSAVEAEVDSHFSRALSQPSSFSPHFQGSSPSKIRDHLSDIQYSLFSNPARAWPPYVSLPGTATHAYGSGRGQYYGGYGPYTSSLRNPPSSSASLPEAPSAALDAWRQSCELRRAHDQLQRLQTYNVQSHYYDYTLSTLYHKSTFSSSLAPSLPQSCVVDRFGVNS